MTGMPNKVAAAETVVAFSVAVCRLDESDMACTHEGLCDAAIRHVVKVDGFFDGHAACDAHLAEVVKQAVGYRLHQDGIGGPE